MTTKYDQSKQVHCGRILVKYHRDVLKVRIMLTPAEPKTDLFGTL